jgi:predicted amidohydrolase
MTKMLTACVQMNTSGRIDDNIAQAEGFIREARALGAVFIALPENAFFMRGDDTIAPVEYTMDTHPGVKRMEFLARELDCWILIGSVFVTLQNAYGNETGKWANRSVLINPLGVITATYDKIHLFDADFGDGECYRESERFLHGREACLTSLPVGQLGMTICYDIRFPYLFRDLASNGAIMLATPAAFAKRTGEAHWHVLQRARAIENGCYVIAPAQCGTHPGGRQTFGHSMIVDPWGVILAEAENDTGIILAEIDTDRIAQVRQHMPVLKHTRDYVFQDYMI